jgi:chromosome segregation ATPase
MPVPTCASQFLRILALPRLALLAAALGFTAFAAQAQQPDRDAERARRQQMLVQQQMQTLQQQVREAQAAKEKIEADKAKLNAEKAAVEGKLSKQAQELPRVQGALRKASDDLREASAARAQMSARVAELEAQLVQAKQQAEAVLAAKDRHLAQALKVRDSEQAELKGRADASSKQVLECSEKNQRLVNLGAELLDRYRHKGVADALAQRDPVLGLRDVQMFNLVQDYRDKLDAEKFNLVSRTVSR